MRTAYALLGLAWFIVIAAGAYAFNHNFTGSGDTGVRITNSTPPVSGPMTFSLSLTSSAFENNASIPSRFTCDGDQVSPPLSISSVPKDAKSLALIMDDPDVPKALKPEGVFDHWVLFNIPPPPAGGTKEIKESGSVGTVGANDAGQNAYTGPCPPPQYEPSEHRYFFKLYALDSLLPLPAGATKVDVEKAMSGHIIAETQLIGRYKRK